MNLWEVVVLPVRPFEEPRYQELMEEHHYPGCLPRIGETGWYAASWHDEWVGLVSFSATAWKCAVRDRWIGWSFRHQYDRLNLVANNSRFLILSQWHVPNLASRILSLCRKRLPHDWEEKFGHPALLLETFVDPTRFSRVVYKEANWLYVGNTRGFRRTGKGYIPAQSSKMVFLKPLSADVRELLSCPSLEPFYRKGGSRIMLQAEHMQSLPSFFTDIPDPRRSQGTRHRLATVLAIGAGATLCGMKGYKAMADRAKSLSRKARRRSGCLYENNKWDVPGESIIRNMFLSVSILCILTVHCNAGTKSTGRRMKVLP